MVGKDRYGGFYSPLRASDLIDINEYLHGDPISVLDEDEHAADLTPPQLLERIQEGIDALNSEIEEERYWISPQARIDSASSSSAPEGGYPELSKEKELKFRMGAAEAMGEARRGLMVLGRAKKKLEDHIKRWYE